MPESEIEYLEQTMKRLVEELKQKNCLSQEFRFVTKAERESELEKAIDEFINNH